MKTLKKRILFSLVLALCVAYFIDKADLAHGNLSAISPVWPIGGSNLDLGSPKNSAVVTSPFGPRNKREPLEDLDFHEGIDLRASVGTPVHAFYQGTIRAKGNASGAGNWVRLKHTDPADGTTFFTEYLHVLGGYPFDSLTVGDNRWLSTGEDFVRSGNTAGINATLPPHLHFNGLVGGEVRSRDTINPMRKDSLPFNHFSTPFVYSAGNQPTFFTYAFRFTSKRLTGTVLLSAPGTELIT